MNPNIIPVIGWFLATIFYSSISVPFWYCWTRCGIGAKYFDFLPHVWQAIPFWDCVGLCFCIAIAKTVCTPHFAQQTVNVKKDEEEE